MSMEMEPNFDKGRKGAKRSSWAKVHYRDLALKICEENRDMSVEELSELFLDSLKKHPEYMLSIALYVMANTRSSLLASNGAVKKSQANLETQVVKKIAAKVVTELMGLQMPNGKTLRESTGAECLASGGWLTAVGKAVGPKGIVGEKLTEAELQKLLPRKLA